MLEDCAFVDDAMLEGKFFSGEYEWIVLSTFLESDFGVYHKVTNPRIKVVIGGWDKPITNEENRSHYQIKDESQPYYSLSDEEIDRFVSQYVFDGYTTPQQYLSFLDNASDRLPGQTKLCLILGATKSHEDEMKVRLHRELNNAIKSYAENHPRIRYVELDNCIESREDYTNQINHFKKIVYYRLAQEIIRVVGESKGKGLQNTSRFFVYLDGIAWWMSRHMKEGGGIKTFLRKAYRRVKGVDR